MTKKQMWEAYHAQLHEAARFYSEKGLDSIAYRIEEAKLRGMENLLFDCRGDANHERLKIGLPERRGVSAGR